MLSSTEAVSEVPNICSHLNSILEGMNVLQNQMLALTTGSKAMQLVLECRLVEMETRLKDGRADDLRKIIAHISDITAATLQASPYPTDNFTEQRSFCAKMPGATTANWTCTTTTSSVLPSGPRARPQGAWVQLGAVEKKPPGSRSRSPDRGGIDDSVVASNHHGDGGCWSSAPPPRSRRSRSPSWLSVAAADAAAADAAASAHESGSSSWVPFVPGLASVEAESVGVDGGNIKGENGNARKERATATDAGLALPLASCGSEEIMPYNDSGRGTDGCGGRKKNDAADLNPGPTSCSVSSDDDDATATPANNGDVDSGGPHSRGEGPQRRGPRLAWSSVPAEGSKVPAGDGSSKMMSALSKRTLSLRVGGVVSGGESRWVNVPHGNIGRAGSGGRTEHSVRPGSDSKACASSGTLLPVRHGSVGEGFRPQIEEVRW